MEKVQEKKELQKETATVDKREEATVAEQAEQTKAIDALLEAKKACIKEIGEILVKYNCDLKAQLTINDERTVSQVFIINK